MNGDPGRAAWERLRARWQEIDCRLNVGEFSAAEAVEAAFSAGLVRRAIGPGPPESIREVWVIEPERDLNLVPGPLFLVVFEGSAYGGPRLYRPVSDELRWDTGLFS